MDTGVRGDDRGAEAGAPGRRGPVAPRLARVLTEVLAPAPVVAVLVLIIAWHSAESPVAAIAPGLVAALFCSVIPFGYIMRGVRRGRLTDHHVGRREQRAAVLLVGVGSVVAGAVLLRLLDAPRELLALIGSMLGCMVVALAITAWWKVSLHTAVVCAAATVLWSVSGAAAVVAAALAVAVGWARWQLGDHTAAQVAVGVLLGVTMTAVTFPALTG